MTAIAVAADDETVSLASDSQVDWLGDASSPDFRKILTLTDGVYWVGAGDTRPLLAVYEQVRDYFEGGELDATDPERLALLARDATDGVNQHDEGEYNFAVFFLACRFGAYYITPNGAAVPLDYLKRPYLAMGSGGSYAMGAMHALADAGQPPTTLVHDGIAAACAHDTGSGGEVQVMEIARDST